MKVPRSPVVLTKEEAAIRQTEAAIAAFERGQFDIALTLAGAAEGMIERDGPHMFSFLRDHDRVRDVPRKEWVAALNMERDWLKHGGQERMTIERASAAFMIARAASKLENWTPQLRKFKEWLVKNLERL